MSAARLAAGLAAIAVCGLFGAVRNAEASAGLIAAEGLKNDLTEAGHMLAVRRELPAICEALSERGACAELWQDMSASLKDGLSFSEAFSRARKPPAGREVLETLSGLCKHLGSGDVNAEAERLDLAVKKLDGIIAKMQKNRAEKGKLMSSLSLLLGLCIALLLI